MFLFRYWYLSTEYHNFISYLVHSKSSPKENLILPIPYSSYSDTQCNKSFIKHFDLIITNLSSIIGKIWFCNKILTTFLETYAIMPISKNYFIGENFEVSNRYWYAWGNFICKSGSGTFNRLATKFWPGTTRRGSLKMLLYR